MKMQCQSYCVETIDEGLDGGGGTGIHYSLKI